MGAGIPSGNTPVVEGICAMEPGMFVLGELGSKPIMVVADPGAGGPHR
jgi:hypothetical protein